MPPSSNSVCRRIPEALGTFWERSLTESAASTQSGPSGRLNDGTLFVSQTVIHRHSPARLTLRALGDSQQSRRENQPTHQPASPARALTHARRSLRTLTLQVASDMKAVDGQPHHRDHRSTVPYSERR